MLLYHKALKKATLFQKKIELFFLQVPNLFFQRRTETVILNRIFFFSVDKILSLSYNVRWIFTQITKIRTYSLPLERMCFYMYILGLESSCDETSAAVVEMDDGIEQRPAIRLIKSNIVASQIETHRLYGGVVPEIASRAHIEAVSKITKEALETAGITLQDIGAIAVTTHPGLIGALLVGVNFAKSLAYANRIPLISVNHIHGHVAAAYLQEPTLKPPFLAVVVSGGHTSFYMVDDYTTFREIGSTRDDACGEAFDKVGRVIGMPYPGGAALDKLAYEGDPKAFQLPSPAVQGENLDFSFSGLKTAALNLINSAAQKGEEISRADMAASYTNAIVQGIVKKTDMALSTVANEVDTLVLAGGVAANSHIRSALKNLCATRNVRFIVPDRGLCGDNAAMIATAGYFEYRIGKFADTSLNGAASDYM